MSEKFIINKMLWSLIGGIEIGNDIGVDTVKDILIELFSEYQDETTEIIQDFCNNECSEEDSPVYTMFREQMQFLISEYGTN